MATIKNPVTIVQGGPPTPTPTVEEKDINFYDYDGTLVDSWTLAELPNKTALPANPTHTGLTAQGWNWTLADLQTQNTKMNVGQTYVPTDGKTHLFVEIDADHLTPNLAIGLNGTAIIDWGDNTSTTTLTGANVDTGQNSYHTYSSAGSYEVTIELTSGSQGKIRGNSNYVCFLWKGEATQTVQGGSTLNRVYAKQLKKLYIGDNMQLASLNLMTNLQTITISSSTTNIGSYAFSNCFCLKAVSIPKTTGSLPDYCFNNCYTLEQISIPNSVTTIESYAFSNCGALKQVNLPNSVTTIGNYAFISCGALKQVNLSNSVTSIGDGTFQNCHTLEQISMPNSVTSIGSLAFDDCSNLKQVSMPNSVTSIGGSAFIDCYATPFDFTTYTSIPSIGSSTFVAQDGLVIKVPAALEASWKATANWSNYASYIVGV